MSFDYDTVSIGSTSYTVYADIEDADEYIDASITGAADTWRDTTLTTATIKARALVSATRWLDSVAWAGTKVDDDQEHMFPQSGIDGVSEGEIPSKLKSACIELAMLLVDNTEARTDLATPGIRSQRAGSVGLEYFRPEGNTQVQTPFPDVVMALIGEWLDGSSVVAVGAISHGTSCESELLENPYDFDHGL